MVRFARIKGNHTKSSFNKVPEEASSWSELKVAESGEQEAKGNSNEQTKIESKIEKVRGVWSEFEPESKGKKRKKKDKIGVVAGNTDDAGDKNVDGQKTAVAKKKKKLRLEKEAEGIEFKRRKAETNEFLLSVDGVETKLTKFDGYLVTEKDAERLEKLREDLKTRGEDEKKIYALIKMERRKAERFVKIKKKSLCFHCRKGGHNLSDCPELETKAVPVAPGSGICFKCGSTEHRLPQCKSKATTLEYATCFICGESGHLSRNCTNNPRGLYPDGGGCKTCGDVTHYERDCPELMNRKKKARQGFVEAKTIDRNNVEALDYDDEVPTNKKPGRIEVGKKGPNKIIKF
uniref:Zinc finger CCHC domain-containing protein 9 n=2 Tax=Lygus hesperus TaxID=30085 RepID=A0A146LIT8_LYGHE